MRTGSRERYTASPVSVFQMVSAMTAATRRDCAGKRAAPSSPGNGDAGLGRRRRSCARNPRFPALRSLRQPSAVPAKGKCLGALVLGSRGITAYHKCDHSSRTPKADFMHFTNVETKAEPLALFREIQKWRWGPALDSLTPNHYFCHHTALTSMECSVLWPESGCDSQNVSILPKGVRGGDGTYTDMILYSWNKIKTVRRFISPCLGMH